MFYGWRVVLACMAMATMAWSLGFYGSAVYLPMLSAAHGWSTGLVSAAITGFYLTGALALIWVGPVFDRWGPRLATAIGTGLLAAGVAWLGRLQAVWELFAAYQVMALGWSLTTTTAIGVTLAPWFDRRQGTAMTIALTGASLAGVFTAPAYLAAIGRIGLSGTTTAAALVALALMLPLSWGVIRRRPEELGLVPDGRPAGCAAPARPAAQRDWTRAAALRTGAFRSVAIAFSLALLVQVGFITHQVAFATPILGVAGTSLLVSLTTTMAILGRFLVAPFTDRIEPRAAAAGVLAGQALAFAGLALHPAPWMLYAGGALFGFGVGNVITLPPIIVRREFGAAAFGRVFGLSSAIVGLVFSLGPGLIGAIRDAAGGYRPALALAAAGDLAAALIVLRGRARL